MSLPSCQPMRSTAYSAVLSIDAGYPDQFEMEKGLLDVGDAVFFPRAIVAL